MRTCTICKHPKLSEINESLVSGVSYRDIAGRYGTCKSALERKPNVSAALARAKDAAEVVHADSLLDKIARLEQEARRLGKKAEDAGDLRAAMAPLAARGEQVYSATFARELLKGVDLRQAGSFVRRERQPDGREVFTAVLFEFLLRLDDDLPADPREWIWRARLVKRRSKATVDLYRSFAKAVPKLRAATRKQIENDAKDAALIVGMLVAADSVGAPTAASKVR